MDTLLHHHRRRLGSLVHQNLQSRLINLPKQWPHAEEGEIIEFELFNGTVVIGQTTQITVRSVDSIGWIGDIRISKGNTEEDLKISDGFFGLSCHKKSCVAHIKIYSTNQEFQISPSGSPLGEEGEGVYAVSEVFLEGSKKTGVKGKNVPQHHKNKNVHGSLRGKTLSKSGTSPTAHPTTQPPDSDNILDLLVFYTPQAVTTYAGGSEAAMQAMILLANDQSNGVLYNSAVGVRYRVVGMLSAGATFVEPTSDAFTTLLDWLTYPSYGYLEQVPALRTQYGADEVLLVNAANEYCGYAWINLNFDPALGFANYNGGCLNGPIWSHEIGHTYGCFHDRFSDTSDADAYPTYLGFGSCWEDTSKTDCTCYSSVMTYQCDTIPNHCTSCTGKDHYANYLVNDAGSATGTTIASCGLWIEENKETPVAYYHTVQTGGIIFSVSPNFAIVGTCALVNISGWEISTTGFDIVSVTLDGYTATILNQTMNYVIVLSPSVSQPSHHAGNVTVTTSTGRVTTLVGGFTFFPPDFVDFEDFHEQSLPAGIWTNNGTIPWSFTAIQGQTALYHDGSLAASPLFWVSLLYQSSSSFNPSQGGCTSVATSIKFAYQAYSPYPVCYGKFSLSIQQNNVLAWKTIWNGKTGSNSGATPWLYVNITLPAKTTGINIFVNAVNLPECQFWASVIITNLTTTIRTAQCNSERACAIGEFPTFTPVVAPTSLPSVSFSPTFQATSVNPTLFPTETPSALPTVPSTRSPSTSTPITSKPTRTPTVASVPTTTSPSRSPTVATPVTFVPTVSPTTSPIPTVPAPSLFPTTFAPSTSNPTVGPTATASPTVVSGLIVSVTPQQASGSSCYIVIITGSSLLSSLSDVVTVTLSGIPALVLNQSINSVTVITPVVPNPSNVAGNVVVSTSSNRLTTLVNGFTFHSATYSDFETFSSGELPVGIWSNAGTIPWSFLNNSGNVVLYKDGSLGSSTQYYTELLWTANRGNVSGEGGCVITATSVSFTYWAYSPYPQCYHTFALSVQTWFSPTWQTVWTGVTGSNGGATPWLNASISLPAETTAINIKVDSASITNCQYWAPVEIDNLLTNLNSNCNPGEFCSVYNYPTPVPSLPPTAVPSAIPTIAPSAVPSAVPTVVPSFVPSAKPTTATPSFHPTRIPTAVPTTSSPSVVPTAPPAIYTVNPNQALGSSCYTITIIGLNLLATIEDVVTVTLSGIPALVLNQSINSVTVITPVVPNPSNVAGNVVVSTSSNRLTTLVNGFTFHSAAYSDFETFSSGELPVGIWSNAGTIPWSFLNNSGNVVLYKDGSLGSSTQYYTELLWTANRGNVSGEGGCVITATSVSFTYWAYSPYPQCYHTFALSVQTWLSPTWQTVWTGVTGSNGGATPWLNASISLPAETTAINIKVDSASITNCQYWAPVEIDNLLTNLNSNCNPGEFCSVYNYPTPVPSLPPTAVPSAIPTIAPSAVPSAVPTVVPSFVPSAKPTTATPSFHPTRIPTAVPTTSSPSVVPTAPPTIYTVNPNQALGSSCYTITIIGLNLLATIEDVVTVTLSGIPALVLNQSINTVTVITPVVPNPSNVAGNVVVSTSSNRLTTLVNGFTFHSAAYSDFETFSSGELPVGIWSNAGTIPWSFLNNSGNVVLYKDGSLGSSTQYYTELLWTANRGNVSGEGGCVITATSVSFTYWAYSPYPQCYHTFALSVQTWLSPTWQTVWTGVTGSNGGATPWLNASISLPAETTAINIKVDSASITNCQYWAPVEIDNLLTNLNSNCNPGEFCSVYNYPTPVPSLPPTAVPSAIPTIAPSAVPSAVPTVVPSFVPSAKPTTATPSFHPTRIPTAVPTTSSPSVVPTAPPAIYTVNPNQASGSSCYTITIIGLKLLATIEDVVTVTLSGIPALVLNQSINSVTVITPVVPNPSNVAGNVVVSTSSNRLTTLVNGFTFHSAAYSDFETFSSGELPVGIWSNAGTIPWSFLNNSGNVVLYKDGSLGSSTQYYTELLWTANRGNVSGEGGCVITATSVSFTYWAYSPYPQCYHTFALSVQTWFSPTWQTVWTGVTGSNGGATPWLNASISLPAETTAINIKVDSASITNCQYWAPVEIDNLLTNLNSNCNPGEFCSVYNYPTPVPSLPPTAVPSAIPTIAPSAVPSAVPTVVPSFVPSAKPTTATPSFHPTRIPTAVPTTSSPSVVPTAPPTIYTVNPNQASGSSCYTITIIGLNLLATIEDVVTVTLSGIPALVLNQSINTVTVITPVVPNPSNVAGNVVVSTSSNRLTTLVNGFTFHSAAYSDFETFSSGELPVGIWSNAGTIPWSFLNNSGNVVLYKDGSLGSSTQYYTELLWTANRGNVSGEGGCVITATSVSFTYWAYSPYPQCYHTFALSVQTWFSPTWQTVWTGVTGSNGGATPWLNASISLPAETTAIKIKVDSASITNCQYWAPVEIDNLLTNLNSNCNPGEFCSVYNYPTPVPSLPPTAVPSAIPTIAPSAVPSAVPTVRPSFVPSAKPTTATPSFHPSKTPTAVPTTFNPSIKPSASVKPSS